MAPISAGAQKMNQLLQQRRRKLNKVKNFRKQRILKHYHKAQESYDQQLKSQLANKQQGPNSQNKQLDPEVQRKINFYNQVFNEPHVNERISKNKNKNKKNKNRQFTKEEPKQKDQSQIAEQKLNMLKDKKVKLIKKMKVQKTPKGQPVMRNMIQYALTKIQENLQKQKIQNLKKEDNKKSTNAIKK